MEILTVTEIASEAHRIAVNNDVYGPDPVGAIVDKLREEVDEFHTAVICDERPKLYQYKEAIKCEVPREKAFSDNMKNTTPDELADIILVALSSAVELGFDIEYHIREKLAYNSLRADMKGPRRLSNR